MDTFEELLLRWKEAELAASTAESQAQSLGQSANDPRVRELLLQARRLREAADMALAALRAHARNSDDLNR